MKKFIKFMEIFDYKIAAFKKDVQGVLNGELTRIDVNGAAIDIRET